MNFITHSLLPVVLKQTTDVISGRQERASRLWKEWVLIGIFGTLPDLLDFHMTVFERWTSYSHSWPLTSIVLATGLIGYLVFRKQSFSNLFLWCGMAYLLHIPCDIVSGGLDFFSNGNVMGGWWISYFAWPFLDLGLVALFAKLLITTNHTRKTKEHE